jgi:hypothetical protein
MMHGPVIIRFTFCIHFSYYYLYVAAGWTVRGLNPVGVKIFRTRSDRPGTHPASYTMGTGSFPGIKQPGRGVDHPSPCNTEFKGRVQLYLLSTSFGP